MRYPVKVVMHPLARIKYAFGGQFCKGLSEGAHSQCPDDGREDLFSHVQYVEIGA